MAKTAAKKVRKFSAYIDGPTPERMGKDVWSLVSPPQGGAGKSVAKIHKVVVRGSVDDLYHLGALDFWQWTAACQYRELQQDGWPAPRVVGGYEHRTSGSGDHSPVPMTEKAERARGRLKRLRQALTLEHRGLIEDAIGNERPAERGRKRKNYLDALRGALNACAREMGLVAA